MFAFQRVEFAERGRFSNTKMLPPEDWMDALRELMKGYRKQGAIRSLDALLMTLCQGDAVAVLMLKHVMEWQPHSIREDGAIWRSADEWMQYTALTRSMVYNTKRRELLKKAGLKVWVERAMGENCLHFSIDAAKLTANIAAALGLNYNLALIKMWRIVPIEVPQAKDPIPFPKTGSSYDVPRVSFDKIPLTESTTEFSTDKTTSVLLNSVSLSVEEKAKYGVLSADVVQKIFDTMAEKKKAGSLKKNPLAYLRGALTIALKEHEEQAPPPAAKNPPLNPLPENEALPIIPTAADKPAGTVPSWARDLVVDVPGWWTGAMRHLQALMGRDWPYLAIMKYGDCDGDLVRVHVPQDAGLFYLQRFQRNIERALSDSRMVKTRVVFESGVG